MSETSIPFHDVEHLLNEFYDSRGFVNLCGAQDDPEVFTASIARSIIEEVPIRRWKTKQSAEYISFITAQEDDDETRARMMRGPWLVAEVKPPPREVMEQMVRQVFLTHTEWKIEHGSQLWSGVLGAAVDVVRFLNIEQPESLSPVLEKAFAGIIRIEIQPKEGAK